MKNFLTGHFYEIQGLMYILVAKQLDSHWWEVTFFWYGVFGIIVGLLIQGVQRSKTVWEKPL